MEPAFFQTIRVRDSAIADFTYEEPIASLLGSHKGSMVDLGSTIRTPGTAWSLGSKDSSATRCCSHQRC
jgi:hypothetical protein